LPTDAVIDNIAIGKDKLFPPDFFGNPREAQRSCHTAPIAAIN
jgi:hypothetical protein